MFSLDNNRNFELIKVKHELQDLIQGNGREEQGGIIQATARFLRGSKTAGARLEEIQHSKEQETEKLIFFINENQFWYHSDISENNKIGEGAEQQVYYFPEKSIVIKLNDSIYFAYWEDYINNLILHNYFFPSIQYSLLGFLMKNNVLYAVVEQLFVRATAHIDLDNVRDFLKQNGFKNTKNNDYYHSELGIILEDLHDENVINSEGVLQFIDTVFYLTPDFYKS